MKYMLQKSICALLLGGSALLAQADVNAPAEMESIDRVYRQRLEAACRPVNDWYADQLVKLYRFYGENNQPAEAAYVKQKLLAVSPDTELPALAEKPAAASTPTWTAPSAPTPAVAPVAAAKTKVAPQSDSVELDKVQKILHGDGIPIGLPLVYPATSARLTGKVKLKGDQIGSWRGDQSSASWSLGDIKPGTYEIWLDYSTSRAEPTSFDVVAGTQVLKCKRGRVDRTGAWHRFKQQAIGRIYIEPGAKTISIVKTERGSWLFNLKELQLKPIRK